MAEYNRAMNVKQGFDFKKDQQATIGFLTSLKIGMETFTPDFTVNSPMAAVTGTGLTANATATIGALTVVGVLANVTWALGDTDPLIFEAQVSIASKQAISALVYASMIDVDCEVGFVVYEYDPLSKKYYAAFSNSAQAATDAAAGRSVRGQIQKDGEALGLEIDAEAGTDVESPKNYKLTLKVVPKPEVQSLLFATSATRKVTKNWGRQGPAT
ncbi:MAG: hypothetical protein JNM40_05630 [Myxococcales bacterium]|nr:hypothetical protein [Myxococcales bacterium]